MLIPLGTDRPIRRKPVVTHALIALNLGVFVAMAVLAQADEDLANRITSACSVGRTLDYGGVFYHKFALWQPVTSAFFHAGFMHIFGNMIFLLVFGPSVEDRFGRAWYLVFYLAGAVVSALAHMADTPAPAIGASGAVAAVSGAYLVLFPRTRIKCFVFFIMIGVFAVPSWWLIGLYIVLDLLSHVFTPENGIANIAHLGGYAMGALVAMVLLWTKVLEREPYDLFSILRQRQRRRAFASATRIQDQQMARVGTQKSQRMDPRSQEIADARARIGTLLSEGEQAQAADAYLAMLGRFADDENAPLTLHRDAQYQVANTLYQRGDRPLAADAFERLLRAYPGDAERGIIRVLIARTRAWDQNDPARAVATLEALGDDAIDPDTRALVDDELAKIRSHLPDPGPGHDQEKPR